MEACKRGYADVVRLLLSDRRVNREIKSNVSTIPIFPSSAALRHIVFFT